MLVYMTLGVYLAAAAAPLRDTGTRVPSRPQPEFAFVSGVDRDSGEVKLLQVHAVVVPLHLPVPKGGIQKTVFGTELRTIQKKVMLDKASVSDAAGNKLAGKAAWARLKKGDPVLLSADGQPVDPAYLRAIQPGTLVFVLALAPGELVPPPEAPPGNAGPTRK
jgi:hypothetical protein